MSQEYIGGSEVLGDELNITRARSHIAPSVALDEQPRNRMLSWLNCWVVCDESTLWLQRPRGMREHHHDFLVSQVVHHTEKKYGIKSTLFSETRVCNVPALESSEMLESFNCLPDVLWVVIYADVRNLAKSRKDVTWAAPDVENSHASLATNYVAHEPFACPRATDSGLNKSVNPRYPHYPLTKRHLYPPVCRETMPLS